LDLENDSFLEKYLERGRTVSQFEDDLVENLLQYREKVLFEGHEIYAINVSRTYRSILGHRLSQINKEEGGIAMGIVYYHAQGKVSISLRSEGDVDVREMAEKHGGGGHKNAASIKVATFRELPFTFV
jgi:phosphoesterase RecJ-like protein